ncbi:MAG TPA: SpoIIE family protein phosphatase, partial [Gaiellaceae bacterium]|nr:SpoIIE family protein phosphatase [Gaiellaceae bacterium]
EAEHHPQRSVITRAIGTDPDVDVDTFTVEAQAGDVFLLCSDGLTDMIEDEGILELVHEHRDDLENAVKALVAAANRVGGDDNITAVAFRVSTEAAPSAEDTVAMPAVDGHEAEPDEQTREYTEAELEADPGGDTMIVPPGEITAEPEPAADARRVRIVLIGLFVVLLAAALVIWGLLR